ncbi:hypothetical protein TSTA_097880 [Talaromyces stipitatus ATCC 10500]|uniref:Reverse transcriptase Ty1/copia-type domain-containing protein n=1 Tax=Talaromyces stipitatus (strain ATCC 10500 / CBS 375.48 / QM 6759 / NRRL 1006) TaxID=441959 RepID=B8MM20_TALSN|nr:uncharacterized protein TSTA_097880 [Talaromyces stipitatus ATCC 10500]EED13532.1 hypothetical protein TSTA_097880 [Talaromyces stipitatus ATCC 10500]
MEARMMGITCHQVPVEAHSSIGKVERYHAPLHRAFNIISTELSTSVDKDIVLQMAVKAVNNTMGPDGIVLTVYDVTVDLGNGAVAFRAIREGKIVTEGALFELSSVAEIDGLIANGTFKIVHQDNVNLRDLCIFNSRLVNEIKGKNEIPYEKSRLVIQGYNDAGKAGILTQALTIQRASQRLLISLIPTLLSMDMVVEIRDITQAYTQAKTKFIPEAGVHWFGTYHEHYKVKIDMETSMYNPCLLVTKPGAKSFGLMSMQTDDTLIIITEKFARGEEQALQEAGFKAKPKTQLSITLASTIKMITDRLNLPIIPVVVCTDSYSLYECLVKLGTTKEKRLMINLMALRQSYEKWEIDEICWIHGDDNPVDAFTKANPNKALWDFIDKNKLTICVEGFVERTK